MAGLARTGRRDTASVMWSEFKLESHWTLTTYQYIPLINNSELIKASLTLPHFICIMYIYIYHILFKERSQYNYRRILFNLVTILVNFIGEQLAIHRSGCDGNQSANPSPSRKARQFVPCSLSHETGVAT